MFTKSGNFFNTLSPYKFRQRLGWQQTNQWLLGYSGKNSRLRFTDALPKRDRETGITQGCRPLNAVAIVKISACLGYRSKYGVSRGDIASRAFSGKPFRNRMNPNSLTIRDSGQMLRARPGLRVPGVWDAFELAVRTVLGQQLTFVDNQAVIGRLVRTLGRPIKSNVAGLTHLFPKPEILAAADLSSIGMRRACAVTLRALALATCEGKLNLAACKSLDEIILRLCAIPGMGSRRANYIAMRAFGEPDAFPSSDLGLRRVLASDRTPPSEEKFLNLAKAWRPWRAYAAIYLWAEDLDRSVRGRRRFRSFKAPKPWPYRASGQPSAESDQIRFR
jgi:3-methyladenine DNA glycosylase/8-oxoguanine DNA glycosylase